MPDQTTDQKAQQIWQTVHAIPKGKVAAYGQIASLAGLPNCARLVGKTLSKLPKDTNIPWFRVINSQGKISFAPDSDAFITQKKRLEAEGIKVSDTGRVSLKQFKWQP